MNLNLSSLLLPCITIAVAMVIIFAELIKKLDKKNKLKGYRVWIPALLSLVFTAALAFGEFFQWKQTVFYWAVVFGISVFGYEAIFKKIKSALGISDE